MKLFYRASGLGLVMGLGAVAALVFLILPFVVVVPNGFSDGAFLQFPPPGYSLRWFEAFFENRFWTEPAVTSLWVAAVATSVAAVLGTSAALGLDRWEFSGKQTLVLTLISPLVVPWVITGMATYTLFVSLGLYGSPWALALTHGLIGMPYILLSVTAALNQQDQSLPLAAISLGASPLRTLLEIKLPLAIPGVLGGSILAFVISWNDVVIATFLAGARTSTLPLRMFQSVEEQLDPTVAAVSVLLIGVAGVVVLLAALASRWQERRRTAPANR